MQSLPTTRKAYCLNLEAKKGEWKDLPIPPLTENQVLIKVESTVLHPVDHGFLWGFLGFGKGPGDHILGSEGAGTVIAAGPGKGQSLIGKKVVAIPRNANMWADYAVTDAQWVLPLDDSIDWGIAGGLLELPGTVFMLLDLAKKINSKAVVSTAAASGLGRQIGRLFQQNGIEVIHLVRKAEKARQLLEDEKFKHVINTSEAGWEEKVSKLSKELGVNLQLDCVGGEPLTKLASLMPPHTTVCLYGFFEHSPTTTLYAHDLFQGKELVGRGLYLYWGSKSDEEKKQIADKINKEAKTTFRFHTIKEFPFTSLDEALKFDAENKKGASIDGKVVVRWQ